MPTIDSLIAPPPPTLLWMIGAIFAALGAGSVIRLYSLREADVELRRKRFALSHQGKAVAFRRY